jgi:hypothetical protein
VAWSSVDAYLELFGTWDPQDQAAFHERIDGCMPFLEEIGVRVRRADYNGGESGAVAGDEVEGDLYNTYCIIVGPACPGGHLDSTRGVLRADLGPSRRLPGEQAFVIPLTPWLPVAQTPSDRWEPLRVHSASSNVSITSLKATRAPSRTFPYSRH